MKSHYRSGVPGDWRRHFDAELVRRFKDRFNDIILKLGYETDPDWSLDPSKVGSPAPRT